MLDEEIQCYLTWKLECGHKEMYEESVYEVYVCNSSHLYACEV